MRETRCINFGHIICTLSCMSIILMGPTIQPSFGDKNAELSETEIEELWSTLTPKPTPLYQCQGWYGGNKLAFPKLPDCTMPDKHSINKVVSVTLYLPDINRQTVQANECYAIKKTEWVSRNFFDAVKRGSRVEYLDVSSSTCLHMLRMRRSPYGEIMNKNGKTIVATSNKLVIKSRWMMNVTRYVINHYFREVSVSVFDLDQSIITTADITQPCYFNDTSCRTTFGILMWKASEFKTCRLAEVDKTSCLFSKEGTNSRLTCPDLQLSMHDIKEKEMCSLTFGYSTQGFYILQNEDNDINDKISLSKLAQDIISNPHKREKRSVEKTNSQDIFNNGKYSYLYDHLKNSVEHGFRVIHHDICSANLLLWSFMTSVAQTGHPNLLVQTLYRDQSLRASFSGDVITVWKCAKVDVYKFLPRTTCSYEWPVLFVDHDGKQQKGFVVPFTHSIVHKATGLSSPCTEFYFDANIYILHLTKDGPKKTNLPVLPQPSMGSKNITIPDFDSENGMRSSPHADFVQLHIMIGEVEEQIEMNQKIRDDVEIIESSAGVLDVANTVIGGIFYGVVSFWSSVFSGLGYFFSAFTSIRCILVVGLLIVIFLVIGWVSSVFGGPVMLVKFSKSIIVVVNKITRIMIRAFIWPLKKIVDMMKQNDEYRYEQFDNAMNSSHVALDVETKCRLRQAKPSAPQFLPPMPPREYDF